MSAIKAGMSRNTARKYLRQGDPTVQKKQPHTWRTRVDPLEGIWGLAEAMLKDAPELEAKALFEHLLQACPEKVEEKQLRTFQRRVRQWSLKKGVEKEVFFTQDRKPGEVLAVDWSDMRDLGLTVAGQKLEHLLFHAVLPYSNWEWAVRCHSESLLSLRSGLKHTLGRLGRVPRHLLIDNSSAATHSIGGDGARRFNTEFLSMCEHYRIEPRTTNVSCPHENGDCESMHGHLKRRIQQHLLLRGSRDFESEESYDRFVMGVQEKANGLRKAKVAEELAAMREHMAGELPDYVETMVSVNNNSTIRVKKMVYSVPSQLIGSRLKVRIYETHVVLLDGREVLAQMPLQGGDRGAVIDFRHVIGWLVRKPGAFAQYRWRESMFPSMVYRAAYDSLQRRYCSEQADECYLRILEVASMEGTTAVENALEDLMAQPKASLEAQEVKALLEAWRDEALQWRDRGPLEVRLEDYDALFEADGEEVAGHAL